MTIIDKAILVRDPSIAKSLMVKKDKTLLAKKDCSFIVPKRFFDTELGKIDNPISVLNCLALYDNDKKYCVINSNNIIGLTPNEIYNIEVGGQACSQLFFKAGDIIMPNTVVVRQEGLIYEILREFIMLGNIPWYLNYEDMSKLFDTANKYAGSNAVKNIVIMHALISVIARQQKDHSKYYRLDNVKKEDPYFIPLSNIWNSYNNTTNKLVGGYMKSGITASLVNNSTVTSRIEKIIRA